VDPGVDDRHFASRHRDPADQACIRARPTAKGCAVVGCRPLGGKQVSRTGSGEKLSSVPLRRRSLSQSSPRGYDRPSTAPVGNRQVSSLQSFFVARSSPCTFLAEVRGNQSSSSRRHRSRRWHNQTKCGTDRHRAAVNRRRPWVPPRSTRQGPETRGPRRDTDRSRLCSSKESSAELRARVMEEHTAKSRRVKYRTGPRSVTVGHHQVLSRPSSRITAAGALSTDRGRVTDVQARSHEHERAAQAATVTQEANRDPNRQRLHDPPRSAAEISDRLVFVGGAQETRVASHGYSNVHKCYTDPERRREREEEHNPKGASTPETRAARTTKSVRTTGEHDPEGCFTQQPDTP